MQVDEDFNIRFVKLVQNHKCLYDKKVPEYRNKDFQEKSWLEIAAETRESVPHCKERWRNLRACLSRYIKQQNSSDPQHKPYYLIEHMQFVLPFLKSTRQSISNNNNNSTSSHNNNTNTNGNNNKNNFNYDLKSEINTQDKQSDLEETQDGYEDGISQNYTTSTTNFITSSKHSSSQHNLNNMIPTQVNCIPDVPAVVVDDDDDDDEDDDNNDDTNNNNNNLDNSQVAIIPPPPPPPLHHSQNPHSFSHHPHHLQTERSSRSNEPEVIFATSTSTSAITEHLKSERKRIKIEHHYADENSDMDFFKSILPDISNMNALQKRKFKIGVLELIDDVLEKYPDKKSSSSSSLQLNSNSNHQQHHLYHHHHHNHNQTNNLIEIPNGYWRKS